MSDINIPGVSDKYKTNDLIKSLLEVEKLPLKREQEKLDEYKFDKQCWQRVNHYMSSFRETARSLYSFENPFNDKLANSTDEYAVSATPTRDATLESFKIDVEKIATADRFLSTEIDKDTKIAAGKYVYSVGEKTVTLNWKGGSVKDFVTALNKRSNGLIKVAVVGVSETKQTMLIESLKTGKNNKLQFKDDALTFALESQMLRISKSDITSLANEQILTPETSTEIFLADKHINDINQKIEFSISSKEVPDVTIASNSTFNEPVLPDAQNVTFKGITIWNENSETTLPKAPKVEPKLPVNDSSIVFLKFTDNSEELYDSLIVNNVSKNIEISLRDYPNLKSIILRNSNTGKEISVSEVLSYNENNKLGYEPVNPVTIAGDAKLKYEGISITRSENKIDDIVPNVTLNLNSSTEKTATITIKPNIEAAKNAIIEFVGKYNQLITELNILTQTKPEIINELEYLTDEEKEKAFERLGKFQTESTLSSQKSKLQNIINSSYTPYDGAEIRLLAQLGISSKAGISSASISQRQMRGYLEIDEKKLDDMLKDYIPEIKSLFGYDSDEDKIIDNGIAYQLDKNLQAYVQIGGILASKDRAVDTNIKNTETKIQKLETQIAAKEIELKRKYGQMESTMNRLEAQNKTMENYFKQKDK
ncbi:MAG: flagellar filament capping protein FliD [Treponema sp.]|nr:flagellar filament capping protein FliD [Treponema sp.]